MAFSKFLDAKRQDCKALVAELKKTFAYVSVLGVDIKTTAIRVDRNTSSINPGFGTECGFVVKMHNGTVFCEYSLDDISGDIPALAAKIVASVAYDSANTIAGSTLPMNRGLQRMEQAGVPFDRALASCTMNPATCLGVERRKGSLAVGKDADVVVLEDDYSVAQTYCKGNAML